MNPMTVQSDKPSFALSFRSGSILNTKAAMSTAFGMTVTLLAGMPRVTISRFSPSQIVVTASARCSAKVSTLRVKR